VRIIANFFPLDMSASLPPLCEPERQHSQRLAALIADNIRTAGGSIPFSRFMELALYAPGSGYYSAGAHKFGAGGDFVTAPELGPLFAECIVEALAPVLRQLGTGAQFLEIGGGSGRFAAAALPYLAELDALPARYAVLEPSADLRQRQHMLLRERLPPELFALVHWLDGPPDETWDGVMFANEVIDALPATRFAIAEGAVWEDHVTLADDPSSFATVLRPADGFVTAAVRQLERQLEAPFAQGYRSELLPQLPYWVQAVTGPLQRGALLFTDYGYPRREYYHPQRSDGTLRAFYRHHVSNDLLARVGLQDLTASVDFTALAEAGAHAGFELQGYCTQAGFLLGNGLESRLMAHEARTGNESERFALRHQVKQLTLPGEMGERFQAMGFALGVDFSAAFANSDLSHRL